jgi:hypothetical protein
MNVLADRRKAFEERFRHEQDLRFKITVRRNRLIGDWAAGLLGLLGGAADKYAEAVVYAYLERPGDDDIVTKLESDFRSKGIISTRAELRNTLAQFAKEARRQLMSE